MLDEVDEPNSMGVCGKIVFTSVEPEPFIRVLKKLL